MSLRVTGVDFWKTKPRLATEPMLVGVVLVGVAVAVVEDEELFCWNEEDGVDLLLLRKELQGLKFRGLSLAAEN